MQKRLFIFLLSACVMGSCDDDISRSEVPSIVLNAVESRYAALGKVEWEKSGNVYEAEIDLNDSTELSARIDASGTLLMQKQNISIAELDSAVLASIRERYGDYNVENVEMIKKDGSTFYQLQLDKEGHKNLKLVFTVDGRERKDFSYWQ